MASLVLLGLSILVRRFPFVALTMCTACGLAMGMAWSTWCAKERLADSLDPKLEGYVTRLTVMVNSIARADPQGQQFEAVRVGEEPSDVPRHLMIRWPAQVSKDNPVANTQLVLPGQVWRAALVLKRPRSNINPHLFDGEAHQFARGIRAVGTVRGVPQRMQDEPWSSAHTLVQRVRHHIRAAMQRAIGDKRYGPVLIALAVGDQQGVRAEDWQVFNLAGMTHLVSISGSHVTLMAALVARMFFVCWKHAYWQHVSLSSRIPAKTAAGGVAMMMAFLYCLLAGWGVPAQRTFFMLLVAWLAWTSRLRLSAHQVLSMAGFVVCMLDPWSVTSTGFWLSFGAVWVLWMASQSAGRFRSVKKGRWLHHCLALGAVARLQWMISLSLVPVLCWWFQQVSLASPLANAMAIPVVTLIVTPASLLLAGLSMMDSLMFASKGLAWLAHSAFEFLMVPVSALATARWALIDVPAFPFVFLVGSVLGLAWSLQPKGMPARWAGWLWMSAALCWSPSRPRPGEWYMLALDVGQASSVLILTHQHAVLFDAGGRTAHSDDGERVVTPVLRSLGVKQLDLVMISHDDRDHVGGLDAILKGLPVNRLVRSTCHRGMKWEMDKVQLEILYPERTLEPASPNQKTGKRNHRSCVLKVSGAHHSLLLPGDITSREEVKLLSAGMTPVNVVVAPHHGSDTSSSLSWVQATGAQHVIFQSGWLNRFGHPSRKVLARWQAAGAQAWRTDRHGGVWVRAQDNRLIVESTREQRKRYWHFDD